MSSVKIKQQHRSSKRKPKKEERRESSDDQLLDYCRLYSLFPKKKMEPLLKEGERSDKNSQETPKCKRRTQEFDGAHIK